MPAAPNLDLPLPDGVLIRLDASPIEEFLAQMDEFLTHFKQARKKWKGNPGRAFSYLHYALLALDAIIEKHNPRLSLKQRERLCEELFDEVRDRAASAGADSSTGYRASLKRIARDGQLKRRVIV
jgi:hypothetical protein